MTIAQPSLRTCPTEGADLQYMQSRTFAPGERWPCRASASCVPARVAILGLGPSLDAYVDVTKRLGGRDALVDEVWAINSLGDIIRCDRVFHMDDVRVQEIRAAARPESNIAEMLKWLRRHPGPIYTSIPHADYPGTVAFPLADVMNSCGGVAYFNSTAAYAVAFAVHLGVKALYLFGIDYTLPNAHHAEKGRACVEFYLGMGRARGMTIGLPAETTLMDGVATKQQRLYGYDGVDIEFVHGDADQVEAQFTPRALPTAAEIEHAYDHSRHPNPLVDAELAGTA